MDTSPGETRKVTSSWIVLILLIVAGILVFKTTSYQYQFGFLIISYFIFFLLLGKMLVRNLLSPLLFVLAAAFFRYGIGGIFILSGAIPPETPLFQFIPLIYEDWINGLILVFIGLFSVVLGWQFGIRNSARNKYTGKGENPAMQFNTPMIKAILWTIIAVSIVAMLIYTSLNVSAPDILSALGGGGVRNIPTQEGTGIYFYISLVAIPASVLLSNLLYFKKKSMLYSLLPSIICAIAFFTLGGRARSLTPFFASLISLYIMKSARNKVLPRFCSIKGVFCGFLLFLSLIIFMFAGVRYRNMGVSGLDPHDFLVNLPDYIYFIIWQEIGNLYAIATATQFDPGILKGQNFIGILWPITEWIGLRGISGGTFLISQYFTFGEMEWGTHAGLIGEAYLGFGFISVVILTFIFGLCIGVLEKEIRKLVWRRYSLFRSSLYPIILIYLLRMFFEKVGRLSELFIVLILFFAIYIMIEIASLGYSGKTWKDGKFEVAPYRSERFPTE